MGSHELDFENFESFVAVGQDFSGAKIYTTREPRRRRRRWGRHRERQDVPQWEYFEEKCPKFLRGPNQTRPKSCSRTFRTGIPR